jgi:hypothetical protein
MKQLYPSFKWIQNRRPSRKRSLYNALTTSAKTEISLKSIGAKGMYILHIEDEKGISIENKKIVLE